MPVTSGLPTLNAPKPHAPKHSEPSLLQYDLHISYGQDFWQAERTWILHKDSSGAHVVILV